MLEAGEVLTRQRRKSNKGNRVLNRMHFKPEQGFFTVKTSKYLYSHYSNQPGSGSSTLGLKEEELSIKKKNKQDAF